VTASSPQSRLSAAFVVATGLYAVAGGSITLIGWFADIRRLTDWENSGISMMPNAAIAAICVGLALVLSARRDRRAVIVFGAIAASIGGATLAQHATGLDFGIDKLLLFREWGQRATVAPGRMGPPASMSFTLLGTALVFSAFPGRPRRFAVVGGLLVSGIAMLSIVGFLFGADRLFTLPHLTAIALQTSTMLLAVGLGIAVSIPERQPMRLLGENTAAGMLVRRTLPGVFLLPIGLGWLCLQGERAGLYDTAFGTALLVLVVVALLVWLLWSTAAAVARRERSQAAELVARRSAEDALRKSEAELRRQGIRLATFLESAAICLHRVGPDGTILWANDAELAMLGYRSDEYVGHHIAEFHVDQAGIADILARLHRDERLCDREAQMKCRNGSIRDVVIDSSVLWDEGRFLHTQCFTRDVTEQKRLQRELRQRMEELREADRRKDEFLATLAHELRNPLAPIRNTLEVLKRTSGDDATIERAIPMMERQLAHLTRLVDELMDVSRIRQGRIVLRKGRTELAAVIEHALEGPRAAIAAAGHELKVMLPHEPIWLDADATRLSQVLGNLLDNACKYTEPGGQGRIGLTVVRQDGEAVITVTDNGVGIPPDMLGKVFEMFTQVDRSIERSQGGLGIGLSLVKSLVEMHGGTVQAHSAGLGHGSEIVVRLPIADATQAVASGEPANGTAPGPASGRRFLVVDDNRDAAMSLARLLEVTGNQAFPVYDGHEAVAAAAAFRPDVVLLDIGMPRLNGHEAARRIREQPWGKHMVLVALTGWGQEEDRQKSKAAGYDAHMVKPFDHGVLMRLLDELRPPRS